MAAGIPVEARGAGLCWAMRDNIGRIESSPLAAKADAPVASSYRVEARE